ncbi:MAG: chemotaxis response regulator protein-glutamate methylesterase [Deltaproteobacteria bacterium]|nr:chemotaxis response regulator protein-glutamate methylesterase [Deltaproteobacteria bacterium]
MKDPIRVVVADDSALMRKLLCEVLNDDPEIEVVGRARNGRQALELVHALKPNVVILDINMPVIDGLDALGYIMSEIPTPCIIFSAFTADNKENVLRAMELGAIDIINKTQQTPSRNVQEFASQIVETIKQAAQNPVSKLKFVSPPKPAQVIKKITTVPLATFPVVVIASSSGGAAALANIIPHLNKNVPAAILVIQHMPETFTASFAKRLSVLSGIDVVEMSDNMPLEPSRVVVAKGGLHMRVAETKLKPRLVFDDSPPQNGVKPAADVTMISAAEYFKHKTIGVILTGMGRDGTVGAGAIKQNGGIVIAQNKDTSAVFGMPKSVIDEGLADTVLPLTSIAPEIERLILKIKNK